MLFCSYISEIREVGVAFDDKLSFTKHIRSITATSIKATGFAIRKSMDATKLNYQLQCLKLFSEET